jgi:SpoVK/Ycf46/Vps4 family AAA+-type ATPase
VVSSLLMQMDRLPSHAIVACATNHPELLDRAVWRRFELKLEINRPNKKQLKSWFSRLRQSLGNTPIGVSEAEFIACMDGENMSEVEAFTLDVRRKIILSRGQLSAAEAVKHVLARLKKRAAPAITTRSLGDHGDQLSIVRLRRESDSGKRIKGTNHPFQESFPIKYRLALRRDLRRSDEISRELAERCRSFCRSSSCSSRTSHRI